ncbi:hypothetical protein MUDAN_BIHEEGNE_03131 [Lactiplantibacillus mudanjiangensis]|uniref:hypothetical protein n=1 Tax=Lactiplantibacillus mudanjiangensis TaxID=1296538 RepID=UPI001015A791|nr:hypothetical protein MUDAN_BIHEEGNE_03131 [Lactiplantibacillus mudanjiangensis]
MKYSEFKATVKINEPQMSVERRKGCLYVMQGNRVAMTIYTDRMYEMRMDNADLLDKPKLMYSGAADLAATPLHDREEPKYYVQVIPGVSGFLTQNPVDGALSIGSTDKWGPCDPLKTRFNEAELEDIKERLPQINWDLVDLIPEGK